MRELTKYECRPLIEDAKLRNKKRLGHLAVEGLYPFLAEDGVVRLAYEEPLESVDSMREDAMYESFFKRMKKEAENLGAFGFSEYTKGSYIPYGKPLDGIVYGASWLVFIDVEFEEVE